MEKISTSKKQQLKVLTAELKKLQDDLALANKLSGLDDYIDLKVRNDQAYSQTIKGATAPSKLIGTFVTKIDITAKQTTIYIPLSIASGKTVAGFMYQIEGTAEGKIESATVQASGDNITQITVGTITYAKIPEGSTANFRISTIVKGRHGQTYHTIITRINYKLANTDKIYKQYLKEIPSDRVLFT